LIGGIVRTAHSIAWLQNELLKGLKEDLGRQRQKEKRNIRLSLLPSPVTFRQRSTFLHKVGFSLSLALTAIGNPTFGTIPYERKGKKASFLQGKKVILLSGRRNPR